MGTADGGAKLSFCMAKLATDWFYLLFGTSFRSCLFPECMRIEERMPVYFLCKLLLFQLKISYRNWGLEYGGG